VSWYDDLWDSADDYFTGEPAPDVNELLFGNSSIVDEHAQHLFMEAFFEGDDKAYIDLVDYMDSEYGIDFEESFDWQDFQEWYESQ
jgi:hypothetical protein